MKNRITALVFFAAAFALMTACSKSEDKKEETPEPTPPAWVGQWQHSFSSLTFNLNITKDNTYSYASTGGGGEQHGNYGVTGDTMITFTSTTTNGCLNIPGSYKFSIVSDTLKLNTISDSCAGRGSTFTGGWKKIQ